MLAVSNGQDRRMDNAYLAILERFEWFPKGQFADDIGGKKHIPLKNIGGASRGHLILDAFNVQIGQ